MGELSQKHHAYHLCDLLLEIVVLISGSLRRHQNLLLLLRLFLLVGIVVYKLTVLLVDNVL